MTKATATGARPLPLPNDPSRYVVLASSDGHVLFGHATTSQTVDYGAQVSRAGSGWAVDAAGQCQPRLVGSLSWQLAHPARPSDPGLDLLVLLGCEGREQYTGVRDFRSSGRAALCW